MQEIGGLSWSTAPADLDQTALLYNPPGTAIEFAAKALNWTTNDLLRTLLFRVQDLPLDITSKRSTDTEYTTKAWLPGAFLDGVVGPVHRAPVVMIGKCPRHDDLARGYCFGGAGGDLLRRILKDIGIDLSNVYATMVCKFQPPGLNADTVKKAHVKECYALLAQELSIIQPKAIVLLGADATRFVAGLPLAPMRATMYHIDSLYNYQTVLPGPGEVMVTATSNPLALLREASLEGGFIADLKMSLSFMGTTPDKQEETEYLYIDNSEDMARLVDRLIAEGHKCFAVDCEWGGTPWKNGKLRSYQFSWGHGKAAVGILRREGGELCCKPHEAAMMAEFRRLIARDGVEVYGHNLRSDALWLEDRGIPVLEHFAEDTMLADHILFENAEHGLEACCLRYTTLGRYDAPMERWKSANKKLVKERGFLDAPDDIILPYAAADADVVFRLVQVYRKMLAEPRNAGPNHCYRNVVMPCCKALHEIESNGLLADRDRLTDLTHRYHEATERITEDIQSVLRDKKFNPRSSQQVAALLFGPRSKGGLGLTPVKTTGKVSKPWREAWMKAKEEERSLLVPSTDNDTMEELASLHPVVMKIRDFKILDQVVKNFLVPPVKFNQYGDGEYDKGFVGAIQNDGRIHTTISQMSETGRHKSSKPNCQTFPKRQEENMHRLMGKDIPDIRSAIIPSPGMVLVEADYRSAEIYTLGYLSGCDKLIRDADGDLHSRGAVTRFGVPAWEGYAEYKPPPKAWKTEHEAVRISSKTISFSIPYQSGPASIATRIIAATKGAVQCTKEQAQGYIDSFYTEYPEVKMFVEYCKECVLEPGYIENPFGRRRRATQSNDREFIAAQQREFVNCPIQGSVADALNTALANFVHWRQVFPGEAKYRLLLPVHDAILLECSPESLEVVVKRVIPECMTHGACIPSWCPNDGRPPRKSFTLETDISYGLRWGEKATAEELRNIGVPKSLWPK